MKYNRSQTNWRKALYLAAVLLLPDFYSQSSQRVSPRQKSINVGSQVLHEKFIKTFLTFFYGGEEFENWPQFLTPSHLRRSHFEIEQNIWNLEHNILTPMTDLRSPEFRIIRSTSFWKRLAGRMRPKVGPDMDFPAKSTKCLNIITKTLQSTSLSNFEIIFGPQKHVFVNFVGGPYSSMYKQQSNVTIGCYELFFNIVFSKIYRN